MEWHQLRKGKSEAARLAREAFLDAGKTVALGTHGGWLIMKRHGKLTSITPCKPEPMKFWHDDFHDDFADPSP